VKAMGVAEAIGPGITHRAAIMADDRDTRSADNT
jgi:hypothetical protein